jgi:hypothetical protein
VNRDPARISLTSLNWSPSTEVFAQSLDASDMLASLEV